MQLDIRTKLVLVFTAGVGGFAAAGLPAEAALISVIAVLLYLETRLAGLVFKCLAVYLVLVAIQLFVMPVMPAAVKMILSIPAVQLRKVFPSGMAMVYLVKTCRPSQLIATLNKMKASRPVTITMAVTLRYIPAVGEQWHNIRDAMRMRECRSRSLLQRLECYCIPLFVAALNTADELSAAAVTRGIENPAGPTGWDYHKMTTADWAGIFLCLLFFVSVLIIH